MKIFYFIFTFILLAFFKPEKAIAQWSGANRNDSVIWYSDVQFISNDTGYCAFPVGFTRGGIHLYDTKNGGISWNLIDFFPGIAGIYFHYFDNKNVIFEAGDWINRKDTSKHNYRVGLWYSKDGGKTRDSIPGTTYFAPPLFINKNIGFTTYSGPALFPTGGTNVYKSKDGGKHWNMVSNKYLLTRHIYFPSDTITGYFVTQTLNKSGQYFDSIQLQKSDNSGENWKTIYSKKISSNPNYTEQWTFITKDMILHSWDSAAYLSRDGGKTWKFVYFSQQGFSNFVFTDTSTGYGSKYGYIGKISSITNPWYTSDFSDSIVSPEIHFLNKDFAWAFSPTVSRTQIYTINNASTWTGTITSIKEPFFHDEAIEIFPNPARNSVTVKAFGFKPGPIQLYCYDMNGKMVLNLNLQQDVRGFFQQQLDVSRLSQGIYEVILLQGNRRQEKKVIIMGNE